MKPTREIDTYFELEGDGFTIESEATVWFRDAGFVDRPGGMEPYKVVLLNTRISFEGTKGTHTFIPEAGSAFETTLKRLAESNAEREL